MISDTLEMHSNQGLKLALANSQNASKNKKIASINHYSVAFFFASSKTIVGNDQFW